MDQRRIANLMKSYSIYDAKAKLSELIRFVRKFGPVTITERGTPVVQVIAISDEPEGVEARLEALQAMGLIKPSKRKSKSFRCIAKKRGAFKRFLESRE
jgi:prevent-host-death family protein